MRELRFETGETVTLRYRLLSGGTPVDITGMDLTFAAKENAEDASYVISPTAGHIDDATDGRFSFEVLMPSAPFEGLYSVVMQDALGKRTVLAKSGGVSIKVLESLVD